MASTETTLSAMDSSMFNNLGLSLFPLIPPIVRLSLRHPFDRGFQPAFASFGLLGPGDPLDIFPLVARAEGLKGCQSVFVLLERGRQVGGDGDFFRTRLLLAGGRLDPLLV